MGIFAENVISALLGNADGLLYRFSERRELEEGLTTAWQKGIVPSDLNRRRFACILLLRCRIREDNWRKMEAICYFKHDFN